MSRVVHIVGTGTIGLPLIGLFTRFREQWNIDEVTFHKNTPLQSDAPQIRNLLKAGAKLSTDGDKFGKFQQLGLEPSYDRPSAIHQADVVIDCTPSGNENKELYYRKYSGKLFVGQGSANGFGIPYAYTINDQAIRDQNFVQVVSCNTHNLAVLLNLSMSLGSIKDSHFVCIRRSNDISQDSEMSPSVKVDLPKEQAFGTHHAADVSNLFKTIGKTIPIYSSACKINTQLMHTIHFDIRFLPHKPQTTEEELMKTFLQKVQWDRCVASTNKTSVNKVFSFGRDFGYFGRLFNQTVVCIPSLQMRPVTNGEYELTGFCFTPQDANSLMSSAAIALFHLNDRKWVKTYKAMEVIENNLHQEI